MKGYDYARTGAYLVTICAHQRACLFGEIVDGEMRLNDAGRMIAEVWNGLSAHYAGVATDDFVVMPNHLHGIVVLSVESGHNAGQAQGPAPTANNVIVGAAPRGRPVGARDNVFVGAAPRGRPVGARDNVFVGAAPRGRPALAGTMSLGVVVQRFKTLTMKRYIDGVRHAGWTPFQSRLWQRNYYEHIIRDEDSLNHIRQYVRDNPAQWASDSENPLVSILGTTRVMRIMDDWR
ncbi:MAG: hypothetical protein FWD73_05345 [Polyangiaceae bacterium]|nr:hypothetical protein [Polyangiaceae bacterium]